MRRTRRTDVIMMLSGWEVLPARAWARPPGRFHCGLEGALFEGVGRQGVLHPGGFVLWELELPVASPPRKHCRTVGSLGEHNASATLYACSTPCSAVPSPPAPCQP